MTDDEFVQEQARKLVAAIVDSAVDLARQISQSSTQQLEHMTNMSTLMSETALGKSIDKALEENEE